MKQQEVYQPTGQPGSVYLLHFDERYQHVQHYLGFAFEDVDRRLNTHRRGRGAKLTRAVAEAGIEMNIVRTWENVDRHFERKLKNRKNAKKLCPVCNPRIQKEVH